MCDMATLHADRVSVPRHQLVAAVEGRDLCVQHYLHLVEGLRSKALHYPSELVVAASLAQL